MTDGWTWTKREWRCNA